MRQYAGLTPHDPSAEMKTISHSATENTAQNTSPIPHSPFRICPKRASAGNPFPNPPRRRSAASSRLSTLASRPSPGFTLIELLVVIAIIAILAGFVIAALVGVQEKSVRDQIQTEIAAISSALEQYRNINDAYPPSGSTNLFTNISRFFEVRSAQTNSSGELVDPYGNPYQYTTNRPNMKNPASFDVWSNGKNTIPSFTNDDIGNW
jgi:general secretion pathway protein G